MKRRRSNVDENEEKEQAKNGRKKAKTKNSKTVTLRPLSSRRVASNDRSMRSTGEDETESYELGHIDEEYGSDDERTSTPNGKKDSRPSNNEPGNQRQNLIESTVHQYNRVEFLEKDLRDTIRYLTFSISQDLTGALVDWETRLKYDGGRQDQDPNSKGYDFTLNSFTLWPLPIEQCPKPDWALDEELSSIVIRDKRSKEVAVNLDDGDNNNNMGGIDDDGIDRLSEYSETNLGSADLTEQIKSFVSELFINIHSNYPPPQPPINASRIKINNSQRNSYVVINVLNWKFVLRMASALGISEKILERSIERLFKIYQPDPDSSFNPLSDSQVITTDSVQN